VLYKMNEYLFKIKRYTDIVLRYNKINISRFLISRFLFLSLSPLLSPLGFIKWVVEVCAFWPPRLWRKGKLDDPQFIITEEGHRIPFIFVPNPNGMKEREMRG
jgi:hypothetical protein